MKRLLAITAALIVVIIAASAVRVFSGLPADNKTHIEKKYAGWNGVLQACVCSRWQAGGSFIRWLNRCAADFEKQHDGVYIEFISCDEADIGGVTEIYTPDMYFFSPGVFEEEQRYDMLVPVCMGGYAWVYNTSLTDEGSIYSKSMPFIQEDSSAYCYAAATVSLLGGEGEAEIEMDYFMDIGLSAASSGKSMLDRFIAGEIPCLAVSSADIAKLARLSEAGRGPDWKTAFSSGPAFTDQILYMMVPSGLPEDGRFEILADFAAFLQNEKCRGHLSSIGAIPVSGGSIYPAHSPYAAMEAQLASGEIITPFAFSAYSAADCTGIVRSFIGGEISCETALQRILENRQVKGG